MPFEFIQIPTNGQGSAKEELNKLLRGGRIASVRKEFVPNGEDSFWAFCIEFLDGQLVTGKSTSGPKVDYKEVLSPVDFAVFSKLRDLRKAIAEKEAIPAYSIFFMLCVPQGQGTAQGPGNRTTRGTSALVASQARHPEIL